MTIDTSPRTEPEITQTRPPSPRAVAARWRERAAGEAFLIPIALVVLILVAIPFARSVYYSFTDFSGMSPDTKFVGWQNYHRVFTDSSLLSGLSFTLLFAVSTTVIITVLAIPLAVVLNRKFFGQGLARAVFFFPAIPSIAVLGMVWNFILNPLASGALNRLLHSLFHLGATPWLADNTLAKVSVIVVGVWAATGWHAILYLAYLQSIPSDYYEAATLDGASPRQRFFHITLPLLTPALTISTMLLMVQGLNVFALPVSLTGGGPGYATYTITQTIVVSGISQAQYGQASALGVVFMLAVGLVILVQFRLTRRLEGSGS
ncbi:sugar ABC transporter permease [Streptomyces sp. NPDC005492]|uniref:carbohydrate ABC transporter permease n=1 Tax=Streptomyces sp. NPDC005492 TaxID=3156883 RepID=UPI0033B19549